MSETSGEALETFRNALIRVDRRYADASLEWTTSLVDDLGFDSMRFIDLAVALEDVYAIEEFPMQDWFDQEYALEGGAFTVGSLVRLCLRLTASRSQGSCV